jgi:hypothetical protein
VILSPDARSRSEPSRPGDRDLASGILSRKQIQSLRNPKAAGSLRTRPNGPPLSAPGTAHRPGTFPEDHPDPRRYPVHRSPKVRDLGGGALPIRSSCSSCLATARRSTRPSCSTSSSRPTRSAAVATHAAPADRRPTPTGAQRNGAQGSSSAVWEASTSGTPKPRDDYFLAPSSSRA